MDEQQHCLRVRVGSTATATARHGAATAQHRHNTGTAQQRHGKRTPTMVTKIVEEDLLSP